MLDQRGVLLRHLVEIGHSLVHLADAIALLGGGGGDLTNQVAHTAHAIDNFSHALPGQCHLLRTRFHALHAGGNQALDLFGCFCTALRQRAHFARHHGKTTALLACSGSLHRSVQGQDVGLEGNAINHLDDVANLAAGGRDVLHAAHHLTDHIATALRRLGGVGHQLVGVARGISTLRNGGCEFFHAGSGFFQIGRRLFGTCRQVVVARGDFARGRVH